MRRLPPKLPEAVLLQTIGAFAADYEDFYFIVGDETCVELDNKMRWQTIDAYLNTKSSYSINCML